MAAQPSLLDDLGEEVTGIIAPVSLCMAVTVLLVRLLNPDGISSANTVIIASIAYQEQESDSSGKKISGALLNAIIFVGVIAGMTIILFLLFKYKCYKLIYAYMAFAVFNIFFFITGALFIQVMQVIELHIDAFSLAYGLYNFSVVGTLGLLIVPIPLLMKQVYLIWVGIIVAYIFTFIPEWTSWVILVFMALYDIAAVLIPGGPLKALVDLAIERKQELPALIYEARPARGRPYVRGWGNRRERGGGQGGEAAAPPAAAGEPVAAAEGGAGAGSTRAPPPDNAVSTSPGPGGVPRGAVAEGSLPPAAMEMCRPGLRSPSRLQGLPLTVAPVAPGGGAEGSKAPRRPRSGGSAGGGGSGGGGGGGSGGGGGGGAAVGGWAAGLSRLGSAGGSGSGESVTWVAPLADASREPSGHQELERWQQPPTRRRSPGAGSPSAASAAEGGRPLGEGREDDEGTEWQALPSGAQEAQDRGNGNLRGRLSRVLSGDNRSSRAAPGSGGASVAASPCKPEPEPDLARLTARSHASQEPLLEPQSVGDSETGFEKPAVASQDVRRSGGAETPAAGGLGGPGSPASAAGFRDSPGSSAGAGLKAGGATGLAAGCGAAVAMMRADDTMGVRPVAPAYGQAHLADAVRRSAQAAGSAHPQSCPPGALPSPSAPGASGAPGPAGNPPGAVDAPPAAVEPPTRREGSEDGEGSDMLPDSIKLGLGDFIFYSMLVGRAAMYDFMTVFSSYLAIIAGLGLTLLCLAIFQKALPALPFSIALGVAFYFLTRLTLEPFLVPMAANMLYF